MFRHICTCALLLGASLLLSACGGGGGGNDAPSTGDVSIVFTDGPTDQYDRILITMTGMTLIGSGGQVALYDGEPVTFDLTGRILPSTLRSSRATTARSGCISPRSS